MNEEYENKVIFCRSSKIPYMKRIKLALKLKSISYEHMQVDLSKKTQTLLRYNPVYKKILVFFHKSKPISESLFIIEYIDKTWKYSPHLLSQNPYRRSKVHFWGTYIQLHNFSDTDHKTTVTKRTMSLVDIVMCTLLSLYKPYEEVSGLKIINPEKISSVYSWLNAINEITLVKDLVSKIDDQAHLQPKYTSLPPATRLPSTKVKSNSTKEQEEGCIM